MHLENISGYKIVIHCNAHVYAWMKACEYDIQWETSLSTPLTDGHQEKSVVNFLDELDSYNEQWGITRYLSSELNHHCNTTYSQH